MCFLPLPLLKLTVGVGAVVSCLLSLGVLAITIYANVEKSQIIDNADKQIVNDFLITMYIISIFFLFLSLCGIYGAIKTKRKASSKAGNCLLSIYSIGVMIFLLIFFICTITFFAAPPSIFGDDCTSGAKTQLVAQLYELNKQATQKFCSTSCPCYLNQTNAKSPLADYLSSTNRNFTTNKTEGHLKYQDCMKNKDQEGDAVLLASLEEFLNCGGWCHTDQKIPKYLKFTDINSCTKSDCLYSKQTCYDAFKDFMIGKGKLLGAGCAIGTVICIGNMIMICCLCYHPKKRDRKVKNFYARMMD